jgi:catechol 2,3-dioxygenase
MTRISGEGGRGLVSFRMHDKLEIGAPTLRIRNITVVLDFYQKGLGLQVNNRKYDHDSHVYELGFSLPPSDANISPLLILQHNPEAKKVSPRSAGLYHFAILVPDRRSLALTYIALRDAGVHYDGFADHLVSESLYLRDPENNGIEIYRDRPAREWPRDSAGHIIMDTLPLDLQSLRSEINKEEPKNTIPFPSGAKIGHIHLKVTDLERSINFYHKKLGFDITVNWKSMGAAFLSAGGYHHHVGMNTWHSLNGEGHIQGRSGLENFTITIPERSFLIHLEILLNAILLAPSSREGKGRPTGINS